MKKMTWECVKNSNKARLGLWQPKKDTFIETPTFLVYNRRGVVPHLTNEMLNECGVPSEHLLLMQLVLQDIWDDPGIEIMNSYGRGLKSFYGLSENKVVMGTLRDPFKPVVDCESTNDSIFISTYRGRKEVNQNYPLLLKRSKDEIFHS
jgi:hypothetical protein